MFRYLAIGTILCQGWPGVCLAQDLESIQGKVPPPKEAFANLVPLKEAAFDDAFYNARQQRLREHHLPVPVGPLPPERLKDAATPAPPATKAPLQFGAAGLGVQLVQNRALAADETKKATYTICEPSLAVRGQEILVTGNVFASFSRDGGKTFEFRNPFIMFPNIPGREFCCDQVAYYVPSHDLMVWFLQHRHDSIGNTVRLAVAHGDDIHKERWRCYDFTPQGVGGWPQEWFDYPDIAASKDFLFVTTNCYNMAEKFTRCVALRIPLNELKTYSGLTYRLFHRTDVGSLRLAQGAGATMYLGTHLNLGAIRVFAWADGNDSIQQKDFAVDSWVRKTPKAPGPDGRDWLGFADGRITAAWTTGATQGWAWTVAQQGVYPKPHVRCAVIDWSQGKVLRQPHLWDNGVAYAYPAGAVNSGGHVGVSLAFGGGAHYPNHAAGVLDNATWSLAKTATGTHGPNVNRWGDYFSIRANGRTPARFVSVGFTLDGGPDRKDVVPHLVQFDVAPGIQPLR